MAPNLSRGIHCRVSKVLTGFVTTSQIRRIQVFFALITNPFELISRIANVSIGQKTPPVSPKRKLRESNRPTPLALGPVTIRPPRDHRISRSLRGHRERGIHVENKYKKEFRPKQLAHALRMLASRIFPSFFSKFFSASPKRCAVRGAFLLRKSERPFGRSRFGIYRSAASDDASAPPVEQLSIKT